MEEPGPSSSCTVLKEVDEAAEQSSSSSASSPTASTSSKEIEQKKRKPSTSTDSKESEHPSSASSSTTSSSTSSPTASTSSKEIQQKKRKPSTSTDSKESEHPSSASSSTTSSSTSSPTASTSSKEIQQKKRKRSTSTDSKESEHPSSASSSTTSSSTSSPTASTSSKEIQQKKRKPSTSTDSKESERPSSASSSTTSSSTSSPTASAWLKGAQGSTDFKFKELVYAFYIKIKGLDHKKRNELRKEDEKDVQKCLEILSDAESKEWEGIDLVTLSYFLYTVGSIPFANYTIKVCERIAEILIILNNKNQLSSKGCNDSVFLKILRNFTELFRYGRNNQLYGNACDIVSRLLNEQYEEGALQLYPSDHLHSICLLLSYIPKQKSCNYTKTICMNIAKIIVERGETNDVQSGRYASRLCRAINRWCRKYDDDCFKEALSCFVKCMSAQYDKDKLKMYKYRHLFRIADFIKYELTPVEENAIKLKNTILGKVVYSRLSQSQTFKFEFLSHISVVICHCLSEVDVTTNTKAILNTFSQELAKQITHGNYEIYNLAFFLKHFNAHFIDSVKECFHTLILAIAKMIILKHEDNLLQFLHHLLMTDSAVAFSFWLQKDDEHKVTMLDAIFAIANSFISKLKTYHARITLNCSRLVYVFAICKEYDTNHSLRLACDIIAERCIKYHTNFHNFKGTLSDLCFFADCFGKWYKEILSNKKMFISLASAINKFHTELPNLAPSVLSTLANNYVKCCADDDPESNIFVLGMYLIAKAVFTNYKTNELDDFNAEELLNFTSAFLKLYGRDDSQKSVRRAVVCIAKRLIQIVTDLKGKYGSVLGYFHVFCNAFSLWNQEDESGSLEQALICMADVVNAQFELNNLSDFFLFDLSILCKSFRKLLDTPSVVKAGLSIAKFVAGCDLNDLIKSNMECLVYFVKSFSTWYEKYDELKSFKDAVHVIAYGTSTQLQNLNYAMGCSSKDLANLALCISRCPMDDSKQHSNMQIAIVSIAQCLINFQMKKLASYRVKDLGKLTLAFSYWRDNSLIAQSIIFIAEEINVRDKNELRTCKYKYLNYLLTGFSKFFVVNFDGLSSKVIILASCNIVKAHILDDLKYYDKVFLSLLDSHFSRFSDDWECHEAVIIIRQLNKESNLIFGKTAVNIFAEIKGINEIEINRLLENGPIYLSKMARSCSEIMYLDDSCHTLKSTVINIAKLLYDHFLSAAESNSRGHSVCFNYSIYDSEVLCNFASAFSTCAHVKLQPAMSRIANYIISCENNICGIFYDQQLCDLTLAFREWCDNFPSEDLNEFDLALDIVTRNLMYKRQNE